MQISCKSICIIRTKICINSTNCHIHFCHFPGIWICFLTINRNGTSFMTMCFNKFFTLDKHATRTTTAIIHSAVVKWSQNRHQRFYYTGRCIELSATNAFFFSELSNTIFICTPKKIFARLRITHINIICKNINYIT